MSTVFSAPHRPPHTARAATRDIGNLLQHLVFKGDDTWVTDLRALILHRLEWVEERERLACLDRIAEN